MSRSLSTLVRGGAAAGLILAATATAALADDARDFAIINGSTSIITKVYIAPTSASDWGPQVLSAPINPAETRAFSFSGPSVPGCLYDIHISYNDDRPDELDSVNICNVATVNVADEGITFTLAG